MAIVRRFRWGKERGIDFVNGKSYRFSNGVRESFPTTTQWHLSDLVRYAQDPVDSMYEESVPSRVQLVTTQVIMFDGEVITKEKLQALSNDIGDVLDALDIL